MVTAPAVAASEVELTKQHRERIERLAGSVLAPCCYTEPVSRHSSDVAVKMRVEIQNWVLAGKTDEEILATYEARYGSRVLVPAVDAPWWTTALPWLLLVSGGLAIVWLLTRWRGRTLSAAAVAPSVALPPLPESEDEWRQIGAVDHSRATDR
jgi:cytochrome c-type biogenesis protein CcmH/NrfF